MPQVPNSAPAGKRALAAIMKRYEAYEYLAPIYAKKVFNFERFGYTKEDIVQELRTKIYMSVIAYREKWREFRETGRYKPVPFQFYVKSAMVNKVKDFIHLFNLEDVANTAKLSTQSNSFDYAVYNKNTSTKSTTIDPQTKTYVINGVDVLANLTPVQRAIFTAYITGFKIRELKRKFNRIANAEQVIRQQVKYLETRKAELYDVDEQQITVFNMSEESVF